MKSYIIICIVVYYYITSVECRPISVGCGKICQLNYLTKYGYIESFESNNLLNPERNIKQGLINLQRDAGLKETGIMDPLTMNLFQTPRCGVPFKQLHRQKRFVAVRSWKTLKNDKNETMVTWYLDLSNFNQIKGNLSRDTIRTIFTISFQKWSNRSLLSFEEVSSENEANITIKFLSGAHGDGSDFDGPGRILAHAFYPGSGLGGDAHFDLGENWSVWGDDYQYTTSLYSVVIHEIGHSLGLSHSSQIDSIMYAWYQPNHVELHDDDNFGINSLYGIRPEYKFTQLDPKHRIYKPQTTTKSPVILKPSLQTTTKSPKGGFELDIPTKRTKVLTTTQKYKLNKIKNLFIQNSRVFIYPKTATLSI